MTKNVLMMIGLPACGKTTIRDSFVDGNVVYISSDDMLESIARNLGKTYDDVFQDNIKDVESKMWSFFDAALADDGVDTIVIDRTNLSPKSRARFLQKCKGCNVEAFVFHPPRGPAELEEWNRRLESRKGKTIPRNILDSMFRSFKFPTKEEGFSRIHSYNSFTGDYRG